jgi:hypothetical protein
MDQTRRSALVLLCSSPLAASQPPDLEDDPADGRRHREPFPGERPDPKLPNGKSQKDAIAEQQHADALAAVGEMINLAQQLKAELEKSGNFVVSVSTIKKTEEIEKLARKIRGKLKS